MITIPTLSQLRTQIQTNIETEFGTTLPTFGKNFLRVLVIVLASIFWLLYKYLGFIQKNIFVDTADPEAIGGTLERWGRIKLNRNPFQAVAAQYVVNVTGTIGATISANTVFKSADDSTSPGKLFIIDSNFVLESSPDQITLRALEAGVDSRLSVSDELTATIPIANVNQTATVSSELVPPQAAETIEEYRGSTQEAFQLEPQGGAGADYRLWSRDVQGVSKVYPYFKTGSENEIDVYIEATADDSIDGNGTPSQTMLDDVAEVIEFDPDTSKPTDERGRRPLGVLQVNVLPVSPLPVDVTITGYIGLTAEIQSLIETALQTEIAKVRPFISSIDLLADKNDILDINKIIGIILSAKPGSIFTSVTMTVDGVSETTHTFENGDIPFSDDVTFS